MGKVLSIDSAGETTAANSAVTFPAEYDNGNSGPTPTVDWNNGNKQKITLDNNAAAVFSFTDPTLGGAGSFTLKVIQDSTGSRLATWPGSVLWPSGTAPTLSVGAFSEDLIAFYWDGTYYYGVASLDFF